MKIETFKQELKKTNKITIIGPMALTLPYIIDSPIIYVDGGLNHRPNDDHAYLSIGDDDSNQTSDSLDIKLEVNKDYSDLTFALTLIPNNITEINLFGFLGGRLDHQMIALGSIHHFLKVRKLQTKCNFEKKLLVSSSGDFSFTHNGLFSLISLEEQDLKISGACDFPLSSEKKVRALSCLTLSNKASGEVLITSTLPIFIYLLDSETLGH
ncbi:thiamin pyrophosphokinase, catalytic domain protein [Bacteriovorax sp. BAL6_X]|uniref:hypothetical protein n=1 Tax=Bacteriovorax sp. BAL6_X TaxID=1201290 RepID=UPI0003862075|nr:hypothetical protein [Bacteriovorax sp. BAL6_X]EPZ49266.1 thiamin pyrophosphokinase, catalytic domain protein [Bacteriovorax sp. BAL6_X]